MEQATLSLTQQLRLVSSGDRSVADMVWRAVVPKLRQIAQRHLARERSTQPLSPTELVHETWIRGLRRGGWSIENREHFFSLAAHAMRRVLIDCARARMTQTRGLGKILLPLGDDIGETPVTTTIQLIEIDLVTDRLHMTDPLAARIIELHYFAGFTLEEVAQLTNLSLRQTRHRWARAKRYLRESLALLPARRTPDPTQ